MKLKTKIVVGYSVILTLLILVCGWGILNLRRLGQASEAILRENYRSIQAADNQIEALEAQDNAILVLLLAENNENAREQFRQNKMVFLQWLGRAKDNITIDREREVLLTLEQSYQNYLAVTENISQQNFTSTRAATQYYYQEIAPIFSIVRDTSVELRQLNQQTMVLASEQAQNISDRAIWSMAIAGSSAAALGLVYSLLLSDRLVRPLRQMTRATEQISRGNYDITIEVKSDDELGILGTEITSMNEKLKAFHDINLSKVIAEKTRSEAIIQSISDGLIVVDEKCQIIAINLVAAKIINTNPILATGNHFLNVLSDRELYQHLKNTAASGKPPKLEDKESILSFSNNNKTKYYKFAITPVIASSGKILGVVLLLQDITKLKQIDQLKSEFVATASHELRTPLTGMAMSINLLLETTEKKLSARELQLLETAAEDVERLRNLVNDLLDLSKIESGKIELDFTNIEVKILFEKAIAALQVQAEEKKIAIEAEDLPKLAPVKVDANKITWVLTNLLANALRYTEPGGKIRLNAKQRGKIVYLSVIDRGAGIPREYQDKIFDKFVQVKTEKDVNGSGLGLAICKEIIKAHGGKIWVESTPGEGSTFTFTISSSDRA